MRGEVSIRAEPPEPPDDAGVTLVQELAQDLEQRCLLSGLVVPFRGRYVFGEHEAHGNPLELSCYL